jgi:hypothetical protein
MISKKTPLHSFAFDSLFAFILELLGSRKHEMRVTCPTMYDAHHPAVSGLDGIAFEDCSG